MQYKLFKLNRNAIPIFLGFSFNEKLKQNVYTLEYPETKDRIRGEYENKIRRFSYPEKIFELFATVKKDNDLYMTTNDLFKALCPYSYTTKQKTDEQFESVILKEIIDIDNDNLFSLYEYFVIIQLIKHSFDDIKKALKKISDQDTYTKSDIKQLINQFINDSNQKLSSTGNLPDPRKVKIKPQRLQDHIDQMVSNIFKEKEKISCEQLFKVKSMINTDILQYEFQQFPQSSESYINVENFAKSLISYFDQNQVSKYLKHLESFNIQGEINFEQYKGFHQIIQENMNHIGSEIALKGSISNQKLTNLIKKYSQQSGHQYSEQQIEVLVKILDLNGNGKIDTDEFLGVVDKRKFYGSGDKVDPMTKPFHSVVDTSKRITDKFFRILEIINE